VVESRIRLSFAESINVNEIDPQQRKSIVELTAIGNALLCYAGKVATDGSDKANL
jgi:hypothetical protein